MSEIHYKDFKDYLLKLKSENPAKVYLIFGEDFLINIVLLDIINALIPESDREFNYEKLDIKESSIETVLESMNTYSFFSETKIFTVAIDQLFFKVARLKKEDMQEEDETDKAQEDAVLLQAAIEKGFPDKNLIVFTAGKVDKRKMLYKAVKKTGMIVDCSIPQGNRMADRKAQEAILFECMRLIVSENGKTMDKRAFTSLTDTTGFDLSIFARNLEKLVSYVGKREVITEEDVTSLVSRTKKDPIYELTGAISEKKVDQALFLVNSLLEDGLYPLQILAGITNHIRKLLMVRDFMEKAFGQNSESQTGISYDYFKNNIVPAMTSSDSELKQYIEKQEMLMAVEDGSSEPSGNKGAKTDLLMVKNPNNPYPVFQTFIAAGRFAKNELIDAMKHLGEADMLLKTTGQDAKMVMDRLIFNLC